MKRIRKELNRLASKRRYAQLTRPFPGDPRISGIVVAVGRKWVLVRAFRDFHPDGYAALRVKDLIGVRRRKHERFWESMLVQEGLSDLNDAPAGLPLDDTHGLLTALQERGENVIVECEDRKGDDGFFIGRILTVGRRWMDFARFDALGRWEPHFTAIRVSAITQIQLATPYVAIYTKHLERPDPRDRQEPSL